MFVSSLLFTLYHTVKFFRDLRQQLKVRLCACVCARVCVCVREFFLWRKVT